MQAETPENKAVGTWKGAAGRRKLICRRRQETEKRKVAVLV